MKLILNIVVCFLLGILCISCDTVSSETTSLPTSPGMRVAGDKIKIKGLESIVTMHGGQIVQAHYFSGTGAGDLKHVRSVTKSIVSMLVGIAIEEGYIGSIDDPIGAYLADVADLNDKGNIKIRHLLNMTGGFQWNEIGGNEFGQWINASNQIQYVLDKPLQHTPGNHYNYNTGATHLLGVIVAEVSDMSLLEFADTYLLGPLGITAYAWDTDKQGYHFGGHGAQFLATDMTRFGLLVLENGMYNNQQVVPAEWMSSAVGVQWPLAFTSGALTDIDYGYLWYLGHGVNHDVVLAWGYGGQFIFTVPDLDLIVATTANWAVSQRRKEQQETAILDYIVHELIPAYE